MFTTQKLSGWTLFCVAGSLTSREDREDSHSLPKTNLIAICWCLVMHSFILIYLRFLSRPQYDVCLHHIERCKKQFNRNIYFFSEPLPWIIQENTVRRYFLFNHFMQNKWSLRDRQTWKPACISASSVRRWGIVSESMWQRFGMEAGATWYEPIACALAPRRLMSAHSLDKDCGFHTRSGTDRLLFLEGKTPAAVGAVNGSTNPASHTAAGHTITHRRARADGRTRLLQRPHPHH